MGNRNMQESSSRQSSQPATPLVADARHASTMLLRQAVAAGGVKRVSESLLLSEAQVEWLLTADRPMALPQQRVLGIAILVMSGEYPSLRRGAAALLRQVGAAEDYESGLTECHNHSPPGRWP